MYDWIVNGATLWITFSSGSYSGVATGSAHKLGASTWVAPIQVSDPNYAGGLTITMTNAPCSKLTERTP